MSFFDNKTLLSDRKKQFVTKQQSPEFIKKKSVYSLKTEHIRIFHDGALFTASFTYKPEDEDFIYVINMPENYDEETLAIKAEGIRYDSIKHFSYDEKDLHNSRKQEEEYREKIEIIEQKLENLKAYLKSRGEKSDSIEEFQKIQEDGEHQYLSLKAEQRRLKDELDRLYPESEVTKYGFRIHLSGAEQQECKVYVQFTVPGVSWEQVCVINGFPEEGKIIMEYGAQISSFIDFDSVPVTLTAGAKKLSKTPILSNYIIKRESVPKVLPTSKPSLFGETTIGRALHAGLSGGEFDDEFLDDDELLMESCQEKAFDMTDFGMESAAEGNFRSQENEVNQTRDYILNEPLSSHENDTFQNIILEEAVIDAETGYLVIPSVSTGAYLIMHADGMREQYEKFMGAGSLFNLVSISMNGRFMRSELAGKAFRDSGIIFEQISGINAQRLLLESKKDKSAFGKKMTINESYRITVENRMDKEAEILIRDTIPVTTEEEIEIRRIEDAAADVDQETGRASWRKVLAPQEKYSFDVKYLISYPAEMPICIQR